MLVLDGNRYGTRDRATFPYTQSQTDLNRTKQHWYSTGSGSDRAPCKEGVSMGAPGRYRSRYCTAACTNVACSDLDLYTMTEMLLLFTMLLFPIITPTRKSK